MMVFPNTEFTIAEKALDVLVTVAHFAKNEKQQVLLPTRLHLFFKGLDGIYACINPQCSEKTDSVPYLGKIYLEQNIDRCKCGGRIYELVNDRSCGQIFVKGFIDYTLNSDLFLWNRPGLAKLSNVVETHLCFGRGTKTNYKTIVVDSKTGYIYPDLSRDGEEGCITLYYNAKIEQSRPDIRSFWICPKCQRSQTTVTDFSTKGNDPFFNIVSKQLSVQPPTLFADEDVKNTPNKGRKVLLFSDSRQNAAVLAKDLSDLSTTECMRAAICLAIINLQKWSDEEDTPYDLNYLYPALLKIIHDYSLNLFIDDTQKIIENDIKNNLDELDNDMPDYEEIKRNIEIPDRIKVEILNHLCTQYTNLTDIALCWIKPREKLFKKFKWDVIGKDRKDEVNNLFSIWANNILKDYFASDLYYGNLDGLDRDVPRYGVPEDQDILKDYVKFLTENNYSEEAIEQIRNDFKTTMVLREGNRFLNSSNIYLVCNPGTTWYKCQSCSRVVPFPLFSRCPDCFEDALGPISDFSSLNFFRKPAISVIENTDLDPLRIINVEEHTAQLSYKDQDKMWSTTEDYELRFQNIYTGDSKPVDILSCTTTMEVGIDIGSLTAIGLRNVPPSRENYQQRAGRAGRRGASISTIVTYSDKGRYDRHYFENPKEIVSGKPRTPFIDYDNRKLALRHTTISLISEYFREEESSDISIDKLSVIGFIDQYYASCLKYVNKRLESIRNGNVNNILPDNLSYLITDDFIDEIKERLDSFYKHIDSNRENCSDLALRDAAYDEGLIPTYSFPRHVIDFNIFKQGQVSGTTRLKLDESPERQLDLALSEYAPGRTLYVNKTKYVSGGIGAFDSTKNIQKKVSSLIHNPNSYKDVQRCLNPACSWFGFSDESKCPFCGDETTTNKMLTPNGFTPLLPLSRAREKRIHFTNTYAMTPCYSTMPTSTDDMIVYSKNLRYEKRPNQKLIVMNTGMENKGFTVCPECGAAINGDEAEFNNVKPESPFPGFRCTHRYPLINTMLGYEFMTDLVVFEIKLDPEQISSNVSELWLKQAVQSLSDAFCLATSTLLDAEANDLKSGYRIISGEGRNVVEIFLYDNLSSGAGYSAEIAGRTEELVNEVRKLLSSCTCESSCFKCLKNYSNKYVHDYLDRFAALDLLNWATSGLLPEAYSNEVQKGILMPLSDLIELDYSRIFVYPSAWSQHKAHIPGKVSISKFMIEKQIPEAYSKLTNDV